MTEEWDGEVNEEKRKPEIEMKSSQKRRKPLVEWGEATSNPAPCIRTWLLQDTILEEGSGADWRHKSTSPEQMPSS